MHKLDKISNRIRAIYKQGVPKVAYQYNCFLFRFDSPVSKNLILRKKLACIWFDRDGATMQEKLTYICFVETERQKIQPRT